MSTLPAIQVGNLGVPQRLWDQCTEAQRLKFARRIGEMDDAERERFTASLVRAETAAAGIVSQLGLRSAERTPQEDNGATTVLGETLALHQLTRAAGFGLTIPS